MFNGMKVIVEKNWPREYIGDEVYSYRWHPFWQWLCRSLGFPSPITMERGRRIMRDKDPMIYMGHTIICSPRHYQELQRRFAA